VELPCHYLFLFKFAIVKMMAGQVPQ